MADHLRRRAIALLAATALSASALAACTSPEEKPPRAPASTAAETPAGPRVQVDGVPKELADVVTAVYTGSGQVPASASAQQALAGRSPTGAEVSAAGSVGTVRGAEVAVVTAGDDVTLAVGDPAVAGGAWQVVGGWWPSLGVTAPSLGTFPKLVAVVGSDARPGEDVARSRGDSLHVVGLDGTGAGGVVGIPRDSWVPLSTGGHGKINGTLSRGGPDALQGALERLSGLDLQGHVITGFAGFTELVDALGGVPVTLDRALQDPAADLNLPAGEQTLHGPDALAFSRTRKSQPRGDLDRQLNGGRVLLAAAGVVRLAGPAALPKLLQAADGRVVTDLSAEQLLLLAAAVQRLDPAKVPNVVLPAHPDRIGGASVVVLEPSGAQIWADLADGALTP